MRVFKTKAFARFARKERIDDVTLSQAVANVRTGLIDADLGGGVIKQRIAREGQGKRSGYRTIILYRMGLRAVFVYGFPKKDQDNISVGELEDLRDAANEVLAWSDAQVAKMLAVGGWIEIEEPKEQDDA